MVTSHQRPDSRVVRPSRESNPLHSPGHGEAVIQTRDAIGERSLIVAHH